MNTLTFTTEWSHDHAIVTDSNEPNIRHVAMQDADAESPTHWGWFDVYVFRASYRSNTDESRAGESPFAHAFFQFMDRYNDEQYALDILIRYANIFHGINHERARDMFTIHSARGYSQSDWWDVFVISANGGAQECATLWEQWARGDVWFVFPEKRIECEHPEYCHSHDDNDHWSREPFDYEGMGGIYADDPESAVAEYVSQW